ncbi:MAG: hypothetical protein VBE63_23435 [Lamprobacter sp.]|uniref:hypothetical protein n=1 Tax=Lamprobacter sp. TaxID=3100796 RepID=UPI002B25ECD5|nr:hypothetical protein [Lamprobacter sp.]MEA3642869.1 hypothetical protein [Lamprobacter sp.]
MSARSAKPALPWLQQLALAPLYLTALAGCSASRAPVDLNLVFVEVTPMDYAHILCQLEPMAERHTCMTSVVGHYREHRNRDSAPMEAVGGPFVAFIDRQRYRGSYVSNPFAAAFSVSHGRTLCRGRYNAFAGDAEAIFRLRCDDGREGRAQIVLDQTGRNGIGKLWMASGSTGDIVFGYAAVGGAFGQ